VIQPEREAKRRQVSTYRGCRQHRGEGPTKTGTGGSDAKDILKATLQIAVFKKPHITLKVAF
jgi:hypothetical protein